MSSTTAPEPNSQAYEGVPSEKANALHLARTKTHEPHYELPSKQTMDEAGEIMIQDEAGKQFPFKDLYQNKKGQQLIVFIRHFFCGSCEQYVQALAQALPPDVLASTTPKTTMTIIGCGQPAPIPAYRDRTLHSYLSVSNSYPIYCDPTRELYKKLGMKENLAQGTAGDGSENADYLKKSTGKNVFDSLVTMATGGGLTGKGGKVSQNGGEWLFGNGELVWGRRMRHTADHAGVGELKEVLGLE